eukprot:scaffold189831_cov35-Tisochrysis_lutea.AAC.1
MHTPTHAWPRASQRGKRATPKNWRAHSSNATRASEGGAEGNCYAKVVRKVSSETPPWTQGQQIS